MAQRLKRTAGWLRDCIEDVAALLTWDGASWKKPPRDPRNGLWFGLRRQL